MSVQQEILADVDNHEMEIYFVLLHVEWFCLILL